MTVFGRSRRVPQSRCIRCGDKHDAASCVGEEHGPGPGDITICITCGHVMVFTDDLALRELTSAEARMVAADLRVQVVRWAHDRVVKGKSKH